MCMTFNEKVWSLSNDPSIQCTCIEFAVLFILVKGNNLLLPKRRKTFNHCLAYLLWNESFSKKSCDLVQNTTLNNVLQKCFIDKIQWKILMTGVSTMKFPTKQARMLMASHR